MVQHLFGKPKSIALTTVLIALLLTIACGGASATPQVIENQVVVEKEVIKEVTVEKEIPVEKEVIKEVIKEVPVEKEVVREVPKEVVVEKEVIKEVVQQVLITPVPTPAPVRVMIRPWEAWVDQGKRGGGVIPFSHPSDPGIWDIHRGSSMTSTLTTSSPRFSQILEYDPVNPDVVVGDLAASWEVNESGTVYTFSLHDANFHDGSPVTADDVVFNLNRWVDPDAIRPRVGSMRLFYQFGTARTIDDKTVEIPMRIPTAAFPSWLASDWMKIYAKSSIEGKEQDDLSCCHENIVGSGPFIVKEWKKGDSFEYERNPDYFKDGLPFMEGFKVFVFKDRNREIGALQTEQVLGTFHPVTGLYEPAVMQQLEKDSGGRVKAIIMPKQQIAGTLLNFNHPPLDNPKVRRAIYLAMDRRELIKTAELGIGDPASFFQPGVVFTPEETSQWPGYRYVDSAGEVVTNPLERDDVVKDPRDIEEAQRLIREAGAEGFSGTMGGVNFGRASKHAQVLAQQFKRNLGWDVTLALSDVPTQGKERRARTHPFHHGGTFGPTLPLADVMLSSVYRPGGGRNPSGWSHPRIEELSEEHLKELDPARRQEILEEIVGILREGESHFVPMIWLSAGGALNVKIRNWHAGATTPNYQTVHKLEHLWFDPDATP